MSGISPAALTPSSSRGRQQQWIVGIQMATIAYLLFSCQDATIKYLLGSFSIWQLLFIRSAIVLVASVGVGGRRVIILSCKSPVRWVLGARALTSLVAWWCFFAAAERLSMGQLTTLYLVAPILATAIATYLLGERARLRTWVALSLGAFGTLVAANSLDFGSLDAAALVLAGAVVWAITIVLMRWVGQRESALVQVTSNNMLFIVATGVMSVGDWRAPSYSQVLMMMVIGLLSGIAQWLLFSAARRIPVSAISVLQYTGLPWAFLLGFLISGSRTDMNVVIGSVMICIGGIIMLLGWPLKWPLKRRSLLTATASRPIPLA